MFNMALLDWRLSPSELRGPSAYWLLWHYKKAGIFQILEDACDSFLGLCKWLSKHNCRGSSAKGSPSFRTTSPEPKWVGPKPYYASQKLRTMRRGCALWRERLIALEVELVSELDTERMSIGLEKRIQGRHDKGEANWRTLKKGIIDLGTLGQSNYDLDLNTSKDNKGPSSQGYGFSSSHVWMWALACEESWAPKNWCF